MIERSVRCILSCSLLVVGVASPSSAAQAADLDGLLKLVAARDAALATLYLPYTMEKTDGRRMEARQELSAPEVERGWWARRGDEIALYREAPDVGGSIIQHGVWNGAVAETFTVPVLPADQSGDGSGAGTLQRDGTLAVHPFTFGWYPAEFGLLFNSETWTRHLSRVKDVKLVGEEVIRGVRCMGVIYDTPRTTSADDGKYEDPWIAWFDPLSLLVLRHDWYKSADRMIESGRVTEPDRHRAFARSIDGVDWLPYMRWETLEIREIAPGQWLPVRSSLTYPCNASQASRAVSVTASACLYNAELDAALFRVVPAPNSGVLDSIRGTTAVLNATTAGTVDSGVRFQALVAEMRSRMGLADEPPPPTRLDPFSTSACGPNALYLMAVQLGSDVDLEHVLALFPPSERDAGVSSLASIQRAAQDLGFTAEGTQGRGIFETAMSPKIVHLRKEFWTGHDHFAVAMRLSDGNFWLASPPGQVQLLPAAEFEQQWSGYALTVSTAEGALSTPHAYSVWSLLLISGAVLLCVALVWKAKWRASGG